MSELITNGETVTVEPIFLRNSRVTVEITPEGAFLRSLKIDNEDVIYPPTKDNPKRGGIPILGPTPGPVNESEWSNLYPNMPSHGTDRKVFWEVRDLTETKATFERIMGPKEFLFNGRSVVEVELREDGVQVSKSITNFEDKPREIGSAFHPYFSVDKGTKFNPEVVASRQPLESGKAEIIKPGIAVVKFNNKNNSYKVEAEPNPIATVVWSDNPDLYMCVEPWWAEEGKGDIIGPRETRKYSLTITKISFTERSWIGLLS